MVGNLNFRELTRRLAVLLYTGSRITLKTLQRRNVESIVPDASTLVLVTSPIRSFLALYTFKAVIIMKHCTCRDFGFSDNTESCIEGVLRLCELIRKTLGEQDVESFTTRVRELLENVDRDLAEAIEHELIHSFILKETSALLYAEKCSWRVRFDNMYFMEKLYRTIGRDLAREVSRRGFKVHPEFRKINGFNGLDESDARMIVQEIQPSLERLVSDSRALIALRDGFVHNIFLRSIIQPLLAPLVEVVTWYVMDMDLHKTLEDYVAEHVFDEKLHARVAERIIQELDRRRPDKQTAVKAASMALDFTQTEYDAFIGRLRAWAGGLVGSDSVDSVETSSDVLADVVEAAKTVLASEVERFIVKRFQSALSGESVPRAPSKYKSLGRVFLYAIPSDKIPDFLVTFVDIIREEGLLNWRNIRRVLDATSQRVGEYTALYMPLLINGRVIPLGCNPLSPFFGTYIKRTDSVLTTTELLIGDLVLELRGFLTLGYTIKLLHDQRGDAKEVVEDLENYPYEYGALLKNREVYNEILRTGDSFHGLLYSAEPSYARDVIKTFIYTVLVLGERIRALGGPHGLWFL